MCRMGGVLAGELAGSAHGSTLGTGASQGNGALDAVAVCADGHSVAVGLGTGETDMAVDTCAWMEASIFSTSAVRLPGDRCAPTPSQQMLAMLLHAQSCSYCRLTEKAWSAPNTVYVQPGSR
jgi:hypothetical protein